MLCAECDVDQSSATARKSKERHSFSKFLLIETSKGLKLPD